MNLVAAGVDFTAGYFDLPSLDTVFVQGHLTVPAADSHLVKGYVLLGGNLDGTVVVRQFDIVAAGEVLDVAGLNLLHRLAINLAFPAAVGRILHLFIQVVQGIHHIVVFLVPDIFADLGYSSQIRSLGNVVDGDILHLVRMHLILDMEFHLIVIGNLVVPGVVPPTSWKSELFFFRSLTLSATCFNCSSVAARPLVAKSGASMVLLVRPLRVPLLPSIVTVW